MTIDSIYKLPYPRAYYNMISFYGKDAKFQRFGTNGMIVFIEPFFTDFHIFLDRKWKIVGTIDGNKTATVKNPVHW